jgi:hypothetical protein
MAGYEARPLGARRTISTARVAALFAGRTIAFDALASFPLTCHQHTPQVKKSTRRHSRRERTGQQRGSRLACQTCTPTLPTSPTGAGSACSAAH